jgi:hypothetical protein
VFPGRKTVQIDPSNIVRGGGGMNCITQQEPASASFARTCGWARVQVRARFTVLHSDPDSGEELARIPRLTPSGEDVYLRVLSSGNRRTRVEVVGATACGSCAGWVETDEIEAAGEKCAGGP